MIVLEEDLLARLSFYSGVRVSFFEGLCSLGCLVVLGRICWSRKLFAGNALRQRCLFCGVKIFFLDASEEWLKICQIRLSPVRCFSFERSLVVAHNAYAESLSASLIYL